MLFQHDFEHEPDARIVKKSAGMDIRDLIKAESTPNPKDEDTLNKMHAASASTVYTSSISLPSMPALQLTAPRTSDPSNYSQSGRSRDSIPVANAIQFKSDHALNQQHVQSPGFPQPQLQPLPQLQQRKSSTHYPSSSAGTKRAPPPDDSRSGPPQKRQSKWNPEEDRKIIAYRGQGMKWSEISARLWPRSEIGCRLHYQNYLEKRSDWDEEKKNKLARVYERVKEDMWKLVAHEMKIPWRSAEGMHWIMGETEMARRANVTPFSSTLQSSSVSNAAMTAYANNNTHGNGHHRTSSYRNGNTIVFDSEHLSSLNVPVELTTTRGPVSSFAFGGSNIKRESISSESTYRNPSISYAGESESVSNDHQRREEMGEDPSDLSPRSRPKEANYPQPISQETRERGLLLPSVSDMECMVPLSASTSPTGLEGRSKRESENGSVSGRSAQESTTGKAVADEQAR